MIYCKAVLPRAGLGNRLFPWARCRVYSELHGFPMLAVRWWQLKLGPLLRRETDWRFYGGLFHPAESDIRHWRRLLVEGWAQRMPEPADLNWTPALRNSTRPQMIVFEGERDHFARLNGWEEYLRRSLLAITRTRWRAVDGRPGVEYPVGIHVRRGDFQPVESEQEMYYRGVVRTPLEWFIRSLRWLRDMVGRPVGAFVVSDGPAADLTALLAEPNVVLVRSGSALGDLLTLSKANVLLASGGSSFSAWASFLGQMPTLSHPGQSLKWFKLRSREDYFVDEFNPLQPPPADLLEQVGRVLGDSEKRIADGGARHHR